MMASGEIHLSTTTMRQMPVLAQGQDPASSLDYIAVTAVKYSYDPASGTISVINGGIPGTGGVGFSNGLGGPSCSAACQAMNKASASGGGAYATMVPGMSPSGQYGLLSITWVDANGNLHDIGTFDSSTGQYVGGSSPAPNLPFSPNSPTAPYPPNP